MKELDIYAEEYALEKVVLTCRDLHQTKLYTFRYVVQMFPKLNIMKILETIEKVWRESDYIRSSS